MSTSQTQQSHPAPALGELPSLGRPGLGLSGWRALLRDPWGLGLLVAFFAALVHCAWRVGPTYDEHYYIASGYAYWRDFDFSINREHPPLAKLLMGWPLLLFPDVVWNENWRELMSYPVSFFYQDNLAHLDRNLFVSRLPACMLTVACAWSVYSMALRRFGLAGARVALMAFAFNPNVLAQGCLAALDGPLLVLFFWAVCAFLDLLERPGWACALRAAVLFALANLAKFTSLLLGPMFVGLAVLWAVRKRQWAPLGWTAVVFLSGLSVFAACYGFEAISLNEARGNPYYLASPSESGAGAPVFTQPKIAKPVHKLFGEERAIPLLSALKGLDYQFYESGLGHGSFYRGKPLLPQDFKDGNPYPEYYSVIMALKNPIAWLLVVLMGVVSLCLWRKQSGDDRAKATSALTAAERFGWVAVPLGLLLFFSMGKALMGARYVLPVFPFFALCAGAAAVRWPKAATGLAGLAALLSLAHHPHHLMYYSSWAGGPLKGASISVMSDDWGQGLRAAGDYYGSNRDWIDPAGGLHFEPSHPGDLTAFGLADVLPVTPQVRGIVAVNAISYWRDLVSGTRDQRRYAWLDGQEPIQVIDRSVYIFDTRAEPVE